MNPKIINDNLGLNLKNKPITFKAKVLKPPTITFGDGDKLESSKVNNFILRNKVFNAKSFRSVILHFREFSINDLMKVILLFSFYFFC